MRPVLLILASAVLYALAFPPWNLTPAAFVALVPLLTAQRGLSVARAAAAGLLWGCATIWLVAMWVPPALTFYYQQPLWFSLLFCIVGCAILWGSYYALVGAACAGIDARANPIVRALLVASVWVSCELARSRLLTGEPWMLLGYALSPHQLWIQAADIGGVYLLSFVLAFTNACLAEAARAESARRWLPIGAAAIVLALTLGYGSYRLAQELPQTPRKRVLIVQGNNDMGLQWRQASDEDTLQQYLDLTNAVTRENPPDLIVWPESAVTFFLAHEPVYQARIGQTLRSTDADLVVGAPHYEDSDPAAPKFFNSAFHMSNDGRLDARYDKAHLLPFAEYFPLQTVDFLRRRFERVRFFTSGEGMTLLDTSVGKVAVAICFEAIFPDSVRRQIGRGADVFVNLSNDAWLGDWAGPEQHLAMVVLRAVENRIWVVRATTTGISAFIDPHGRILDMTPTAKAATLSAEIVPMQIESTYKRFGDAFAYGCLGVAAIGMLLSGRANRGDFEV